MSRTIVIRPSDRQLIVGLLLGAFCGGFGFVCALAVSDVRGKVLAVGLGASAVAFASISTARDRAIITPAGVQSTRFLRTTSISRDDIEALSAAPVPGAFGNLASVVIVSRRRRKPLVLWVAARYNTVRGADDLRVLARACRHTLALPETGEGATYF